MIGQGTRVMMTAAIAAMLGAPLAAAKDPLEVGMAVALTGYLANFDGQYIDGVKVAVKLANAHGGIDGHPVDLHILDDASNATAGVTVTNQLLNQFNVSVMLNGLSSAQNNAIVPILARTKVPMIVVSVLPADPSWAFLANLPNERADVLEMDFAQQKLHAKKVAIVVSQTPYGQHGAQVLKDYAQKLGIAVVFSEAVEPSITDMTAQMARLKDAGPDAVVDILTGSTHIVEAKAAATVGLTAPLVMADDDLPTHQKATAAYPNAYFIATAVQIYPDVADPALKSAAGAFLAASKDAGLDPKTVTGASLGWDAVRILTSAIDSSHATGGQALRAALEQVRVQGANTLYQFSPTDHSGQAHVPNPLAIAQFKDDKIAIVFAPK